MISCNLRVCCTLGWTFSVGWTCFLLTSNGEVETFYLTFKCFSDTSTHPLTTIALEVLIRTSSAIFIKFWIFARFSKRGGYFFGEINDTKLVYFLHRSAESFKISGSKTVCFSC